MQFGELNYWIRLNIWFGGIDDYKMPTIYNQKCKCCNIEYKGRGKYFCSVKCAVRYNAVKKKNWSEE